MAELVKKIKQFGDQKNTKELQEYISSVDTAELTSLVSEQICHRNSIQILNYILLGFTDSSESHQKRFQVVSTALNVIDENDVSNTVSHAIVTRLRLELPKFKTNHLVEICNSCIEKIQKGHILHTNWKDLLPEILNILAEKDCVTYNNSELSGLEFKKQIIASLCMINWSPNIVTPLSAMFRDVPLTKDEHLQVVTKLGQCMEKLTCQEVPAFTYQLLKLCSIQNSRCIFLRLQYYFSNRIYKNLGKDLEPSSDTTDLDDISDTSEHDALQVESTVLFHIHNSAMYGHGSIKEYINSLRNMLKAPEFVLHPFQLTVLLTVSTVSVFEEQALETIRGCIVRVITEEFKKSESAWFSEIVTTSTKISNIISAVIENSLKERQLVVAGLINLGFVLLGVGAALGSKNIAEAQWELGTFILLKLMKKKREVSSTVVQQLCNRIITGQNVPHLTECLHQMCRNLTLAMLESQGHIIQLIEQILLLPGATSRFIINAIIPLVKVSPTIRDNLILILRKALHSRKVETRQTAVSGYLKLLKSLRISNLSALSQSSSSASNYSFLTQISLDCQTQQSTNKFSNEALCLEVLGILRRCFMQQAEVRAELYDGLYDAVCMNAELEIPVLDLLWNHFKQFYNNEESALPPLYFSNIVLTKGVDVVLQEPLGHLIFVIGLVVTKVLETNEASNPSITRVTDILDSLCDRMAKCELIHFDLDSGRDLLDILPECQTDLHILKQAMSVYESLMGYLISTWGPNSENTGQKVYALFQAYFRLVEFSKNLSKPKKADGRKKTKDKDVSHNKTTSLKTKAFKPLSTVIDFQTAGKILNLLHEPTVPWADISQTNVLRVKREFHRYILSIIIQLVQNVKASKCIETFHTRPYFGYCTAIATVLYKRVIKRLSFVLDFDCVTAVLAVESFHAILSLVANYYKEKLNTFLGTVGSKDKNEELEEHLMPFIEIYQSFFEQEEDEYADDTEGKKLPVLMVNTYTILVTNLPAHSSHATKVLDWLKKYTDENVPTNKLVGNGLISLLLNMHIRCKTASGLYENVAIRLCEVIGTVNHDKPECSVSLKIINEGTALPTLLTLANAMKSMLNEVDWLVQRFRAEYTMIIYPGGEQVERRKELLKAKERDVCCHICQIINVCMLISNMAVPAGANAEIIFKILMHLFNTLNSLTKYFLFISSRVNPAFQSARFERVLKLSGKPLTKMVYEFILYIEEGQSQGDDGGTQAKKKSSNASSLKTKVLRETRLIPKLVYEIEQFGRNVITLSNKTKIDLSKYVGLGTSRDFRIKLPELQEALKHVSGGGAAEEEQETDPETSMEVADEDADADGDVTADRTETPPPSKKLRKSK